MRAAIAASPTPTSLSPQGLSRIASPAPCCAPPVSLRQDFAELTAANELDIAAVSPDFRAQAGPGLLRLFTSWKTLLSGPAWQSVQTMLP